MGWQRKRGREGTKEGKGRGRGEAPRTLGMYLRLADGDTGLASRTSFMMHSWLSILGTSGLMGVR